MRIIADTATLIPPCEGTAHGLVVLPVCVAINGRTYQDYSEISSSDFLELIKERLQRSIESSVSFVIPEDFEFLKRSGRLTPFTAKVGSALKLLPVLTQTKDRKRIVPIGIKRSWKSAVDVILQQLQTMNIGTNHLISVCHAGVPQRAEQVLQQVKERFASSDTEILELSPALTTHGGPGCIVIQAICK